jgi:hypothetical protein
LFKDLEASISHFCFVIERKKKEKKVKKNPLSRKEVSMLLLSCEIESHKSCNVYKKWQSNGMKVACWLKKKKEKKMQ